MSRVLVCGPSLEKKKERVLWPESAVARGSASGRARGYALKFCWCPRTGENNRKGTGFKNPCPALPIRHWP
eukprot:3238494-Prymnesium_polylepis.1